MRANTRTVLAGTIGNVLEWYDFAVYGFLAPILGRAFFPADDPVASLLAAFGVFAIGYAARPIGGAIFGHIGDKFGRKPCLILSVSLMGLATVSIGVLPDHAVLGTTAAALLVLLRVFQGLSVGGEFTGSIVFLAEQAPPNRRGLRACWPQFGCLIGFLLGSGIGALTSTILGEAAMDAWGWRVPFLFGAVIAVCGLVFRRQLTESPAMAQTTERIGAPVIAALRDYWPVILKLICLIMVAAVGFYMIFIYAASYLTEQMHLSTAKALDINTISLLVMLAVTLPGAALSDRWGRRPLLMFFALGTLICAWPLWWLMHQDSFALILLGQMGFALFFGVGFAVAPATMIEMLPAQVRCSGVSIGYNACIGLLGGTTPLVATYLTARTADDFAPVYYLMAAATLSIVIVWRLPEMAGKPLPN